MLKVNTFLVDLLIVPVGVHGDELLRDAVVLAHEERVHHRQVGLLVHAAVACQEARLPALAVVHVVVAGKQVAPENSVLHPHPAAAPLPNAMRFK